MRPLCDLALDVVIKVEYNSMRMLECARQESKHTSKIPETNLSYFATTICAADLLLAKHVTGGDVQGTKPACATALEGQKGQCHAKYFICRVLPPCPSRYGMLLARALGKEKAKIKKEFLVSLNISLLTRLSS